MPAKIFISHSCKDFELAPIDENNEEKVARWKRLDFARLVRNEIVDGLEDLGFKVLLDRNRLNPTELWRAKLRGWLGICDGAVLLLSARSSPNRIVSFEWARRAMALPYRAAASSA